MTARLEDLTPGAVVNGVVAGQTVTTVASEWHGTSCDPYLPHLCREVGHQLVYRADEAGLEVHQAGRAWSFDADGDLFRLAAEARRIRLAYLFDPASPST